MGGVAMAVGGALLLLTLVDVALHRFRAATEELLTTLESSTSLVSPSGRAPGPPDVGVVADLADGIDPEELRAERLSELTSRRAALLVYVDGDGAGRTTSWARRSARASAVDTD